MQRNSDSKKRRSNFNPNRTCYLSADGKYYVYEAWDECSKRNIVQRLEVGRDLSVDLTIFLDESDHDMDLNDRYQKELHDPLFDAKIRKHDSNDADENVVNPWDTLADRSSSPEDVLFAEPEPDNPHAATVRRVIEENCTEAQREFFFTHFGEGKQLEEMRQAEAAQTGKLPSAAAMTNRKNKIIDKAAKELGVERVKRHQYPKKDES